MEEADWSNLNRDLLEKIGKNLLEKIGKNVDTYSDYASLRAVCLGWRSSLSENWKKFQQRFPSLLLPYHPKVENTSLCLLNPLLPDEINHMHLQLPFDGLLIRGFSKGWLVALEIKGPAIFLIDPYSNEIQQLPPVYTFSNVLEHHPDRVGKECVLRSGSNNWRDEDSFSMSYQRMGRSFIDKIVLSSFKNFTAIAIHGEFRSLSVCKQGDERWTPVHGADENCFTDVIFHKDKIYAIDCNGQVLVVSDSDSSLVPMYASLPPGEFSNKFYLVEWYNDLLVVARVLKTTEDDPDYYQTSKFFIFKLELSLLESYSISSTVIGFKNILEESKKMELEKMISLGNNVLFLGQSESIALQSQNFPGCKGNHIYFSDDYLDGHYEGVVGGSDFGVFACNDEDSQPLPGYPCNPKLRLTPLPIWIMRNC